MMMTATPGLIVPFLPMGKLWIVPCSGFIVINNQQNRTIYLKSPIFTIFTSIFTIKLPPPKKCLRCLLWSKTCVARGSFNFPAHHIHCKFTDWHIYTIFPRRPHLSLPHKHAHKQAILKKRTRSIFAGNYPFTSSIHGLNQLWLTKFLLAALNPCTQLSWQHHFWTVALCVWNISEVPVHRSILLTTNGLSLGVLPSEQYWAWMLGSLRGKDTTMSLLQFLKDLQRTKTSARRVWWKFKDKERVKRST